MDFGLRCGQQAYRPYAAAKPHVTLCQILRTGRAAIQAVLELTANCVSKPRLRKRSGGEVKVPAYEAMQLGARMLDMEGRLDAQLC